MLILHSLLTGIRKTLRSYQLLLLLYLLNGACAVPLALAFRSSLSSAFGSSTAAEQLLGGFDYTILRDLLSTHGVAFSALWRVLLWSLPLYALLHTVLAGGVIAHLAGQARGFTLRVFLRDCGTYFSRLLRIFLLFTAVLTFLTVVLTLALGFAVDQLAENVGPEATVALAALASGIVLLFPLLFVQMVADYTRIAAVLTDEPSMATAVGYALRFIARNPVATFGLQIALVLLVVLLGTLVVLQEAYGGIQAGKALLLLGLIQQLLVLLRVFFRLVGTAAEISLFQELNVRPHSQASVQGMLLETESGK